MTVVLPALSRANCLIQYLDNLGLRRWINLRVLDSVAVTWQLNPDPFSRDEFIPFSIDGGDEFFWDSFKTVRARLVNFAEHDPAFGIGYVIRPQDQITVISGPSEILERFPGAYAEQVANEIHLWVLGSIPANLAGQVDGHGVTLLRDGLIPITGRTLCNVTPSDQSEELRKLHAKLKALVGADIASKGGRTNA